MPLTMEQVMQGATPFKPPAAPTPPAGPGMSMDQVMSAVKNPPSPAPELPQAPTPLHGAVSTMKQIAAGAQNNLDQIMGELASAADFVLSVPAMAPAAMQSGVALGMNLLTGATPSEALQQANKRYSEVAAQLTNPMQKVLSVIHKEKPYDQAVTSQAMQKVTSVIEEADKEAAENTGGRIPKGMMTYFANTVMGILGGKGTEFSARAIAERAAKPGEAKAIAKAAEKPTPPAVDKEYTDWARGLSKEAPAPTEAAAADKALEELGKPAAKGAAKPRIKLKLTPEKAVAGVVAGGAAAYVLDPDYRKQIETGLGGMGLAMALAVKPKGGMWHPEAVERLSKPIEDSLTPRTPEQFDVARQGGRTMQHYIDWSRKSVRNYLNKHAGTEGDPLRDVEIPYGRETKTWGEVTDQLVSGIEAKFFQDTERPPTTAEDAFAGASRIPREEVVWRLNKPRASLNAQLAGNAITNYLSHVGDYLREHVPPEKLQQMDLVRAVKETAKWDKELAAKMNSVEGRLEGTVPFKQYPDKFQWVEVKSPEALKREGDVMGHCVGGYCDYVESGEAKIFSLRDPKGMSHVTVEVNLADVRAPHNSPEHFARVVGGKWLDALNRVKDLGEAEKLNVIRHITRSLEYRDWLAERPVDISQIKGKQNRAPNPEYLPYVQDFVRSGKWGEVGDLSNAGLVDASQVRRFAEQRGDIATLEYLDKYKGERYVPKRELRQPEVDEGQRGYVSTEVITGLAAAGLGALAGAYVDDKNPITGAIMGGVGGLLLSRLPARFRGSPEEAVAARNLSDGLYTLSKRSMERQIALIRYLRDSVPEDYPKYAKEIYDSFENPKAVLSPRAQQIKTQIIEPIRAGNKMIRDALEKLGVDVGPELQQGYVHRIAKGERPSVFEEIERMYPGRRGLTRTAPSLKERTVFSLVSETGDREIATLKKGGKFIVWRSGKPVGRGVLRPGKPIKFDGKTWSRAQATTDEIEEHTPIRYYRDALGTEIDNNVRLGRALENALFIDGLKRLPSWSDIALPKDAEAPPDWRTTTIPQLQGFRFAPRIADILDDFSGEMARHPSEALGKISRVLTGSLFWNPFPHIFNILDHAVVQRGLTPWVNPAAYPRLVSTSIKAWRAVTEQNRDFLHMLHEGAGLMYPNVLIRNFGEQVMRQLGHVPEMDGVAKAFGYANPAEMVKRIYGFSRKQLWFWNDVIMMQAYYERAQVAGKPLQEVFRDVERHIPNYRIPDQVMGSRLISQILQSPFFTAFGRYDYARLRSYGGMVKDLVDKSVPMKDKLRALDQIAALTVAGFIVYPQIMDKVAQALTGNQNATVQRFGASTIPALFYEYFHNQKDISQVAQSAFPQSPLMKMMEEVYYNRDMFSGSKLLDTPNDIPDFLAKQFNPLYIVGQIQQDKLSPEQFMLQSIGIKSPTEEQLKRREKWRQREATAARHREAKKKGIVRSLEKKVLQ